MQKKNLILLFVIIVLAGVLVYPKLFGSVNADSGTYISEVTADPQAFLGDLTLTGLVGSINAEEGVIFLVDDGGCCQIPLLLPLTQEQLARLNEYPDIEMDELYSGAMPAIGDSIAATGTWVFDSGFYDLKVDEVTRDGETIISKSN